jgi:hypothetical protein
LQQTEAWSECVATMTFVKLPSALAVVMFTPGVAADGLHGAVQAS